MKKRILSLLLVLVMVVGLLPMAALAADGDLAAEPAVQTVLDAQAQDAQTQATETEEDDLGEVYVLLKNHTWTYAMDSSNGVTPKWYGEKTTHIKLKPDSTMMSCIVEAAKAYGLEVVGADEGYIRSIGGVAEFNNGPDSGWMGTLNDWFTNYGFANYTVENGLLKDGDEICVQYTSTGLGKDLGADWESSDKRIKSIKFAYNNKEGTLFPEFSPDVHEYTFLLKDGLTKGVTMYPTAMNKQYQVHRYIGDVEYTMNRELLLPLKAGDVVTIKCGDPSWETSSPNDGPAEVYTIKVVSPGQLLKDGAVAIKTIKEDGVSAGDDLTVTYAADGAIFSAATLRKYTQLTQYNDVGFTVSLPGLPEGASAELYALDGTKLGDFADGSVTLEHALETIGDHTYSILVKSGDVEETYKLVVSKSPKMKLYKSSSNFPCFTFVPDVDPEKMFNGQPEGTMFRADKDGNLTGEVGYEDNCWNYVMYLSPDVMTIGGTTRLKAYDADLVRNATTTLYMNGTQLFQAEREDTVLSLWAKAPVVLTEEKNVFEMVMVCRTDPTIQVTFTLTVYVVKTTPEELTEKVNALPKVDSLTYENDYNAVANYNKAYESYTEEEKAQVSTETVQKLKDSVARLEVLKERFEQGVQEVADLIRNCADNITKENYRDYLADARKAVALYLGLSDGQRTSLNGVMYTKTKTMVDAFWDVYNIAILQSIQNGESIGYPTDYPDDFILQRGYYNLDLGHEDTYYETGFREIWTNRPTTYYNYNEKGLPFTSPGLLEFEIKDDSIFEIKEVESIYKDMGLGGKGEHPNMKYYLVPKKAGTTTFTVKLCDDKGVMYCQTPEIVVHVNSPEETAVGQLYTKLTDFNSKAYTRQYDNWCYEYGQEGAAFSFHINGENGKVSVYNYLQYNEDGTPVTTDYTADVNGDVTILLKDGYNCIEVNADYNGQNVTQVYALQGKVVQNVVENISRPGEPLRLGDQAGVWTIGRPICLHKILRIYNNGNGATQYITDMPRQGLLKTDESITIKYSGFNGASEAGGFSRLLVPLTGSGKITLHDGYIKHAGYGSGLGSELTQGNTGGMADSTEFKFGRLVDITLDVADNPDYVEPENTLTTVASNGGVVKAGDRITITVPELPTEEIIDTYQKDQTRMIKYAVNRFYTNLPGLESVETGYYYIPSLGESVPTVNDIKSITFTVPSNTQPGTYNIHGGNVAMCYTIGWMDYYDWLYRGLIDDVEITVIPMDVETVISLIDAIGPAGKVDEKSGDAISAARSAYDALTEEQQAQVTNARTLLEAEARYNKMTVPVKMTLTGPSNVDTCQKSVDYTISAKGMQDLTTVTMTIPMSFTKEGQTVGGDSVSTAITVTGVNDWYVIAQAYDGKNLTVVAGNNEGVTGEGDIVNINIGIENVPGTLHVQLYKAQLSGYDGDGEVFMTADTSYNVRSTKITYNTYDVNRDGVVDQLDITRAQRNYGTDDAICDVNGDGEVNIADLILIMNNYTK